MTEAIKQTCKLATLVCGRFQLIYFPLLPMAVFLDKFSEDWYCKKKYYLLMHVEWNKLMHHCYTFLTHYRHIFWPTISWKGRKKDAQKTDIAATDGYTNRRTSGMIIDCCVQRARHAVQKKVARREWCVYWIRGNTFAWNITWTRLRLGSTTARLPALEIRVVCFPTRLT